MGAVIFAIFLGLIAVVGFVGAFFASDYKGAWAGVGAVFTLGLFMLFFLGGMQTVPVKSIGVPQAFGTVSGGVMSPGVHFTWEPWLSTTNVDETVQTTTFEGNNCLDVRIGGQQSACADATIQWQIDPNAAEGLYEDYANQGNLMSEITNAVVVREFKQVVNQELGDYNPITDVQNVTGSNTSTSQFTQFGPQILAQMQSDLGSKITVRSVFLPRISYDSTVEGALQKIQQANADFAVATENVKVNEQKALAYAKLGTPNLNQLVAQCITEAGANAGQCIPGAVTKLSLGK